MALDALTVQHPVPLAQAQKVAEEVETAKATGKSYVQGAFKADHIVLMQREPCQPIMLATLLLQVDQDVKATTTSELLP